MNYKAVNRTDPVTPGLLIYHKSGCRTALATPGLLNTDNLIVLEALEALEA